MWAYFVVVSTVIVAYSAHLVGAGEPVDVQAFHPELAVQGIAVSVARRLAGSRVVEDHAATVSARDIRQGGEPCYMRPKHNEWSNYWPHLTQ